MNNIQVYVVKMFCFSFLKYLICKLPHVFLLQICLTFKLQRQNLSFPLVIFVHFKITLFTTLFHFFFISFKNEKCVLKLVFHIDKAFYLQIMFPSFFANKVY